MKIILVAGALVVAMTTPALAKHCPKDLAIIDQGMPKFMQSAQMQNMMKVKTLRDAGAAHHKSGNHSASIKALHDAVKLMGLKPYTAM
jgi:cytochrome c peroxidase